MCQPEAMFNFDLSQQIEAFLLQNPDTREYDIIQYLQETGILPRSALQSPLSLFRCHFLVHNALYRLQILGLKEYRYQLEIDALNIRLQPIKKDESAFSKALEHYNVLSEFYLDLSHLTNTTEHDVNALLDQFWQKYFNPSQRKAALTVLSLTDPVDFKTIKKQYRRLVMIHHPDRGGDTQQLIEVHQAMKCLEQYY